MDRKEAFEHLRHASQNGNLIPVIGAGYSIASAGLPSWSGLLETGINFCQDHGDRLGIPPDKINEIKETATNNDLLGGFDTLCELLEPRKGSRPFAEWLDTVFRNTRAKNHDISNALRRLQPRTLLTTNIDLLLEREAIVRHDNVATWRNFSEMLEIL